MFRVLYQNSRGTLNCIEVDSVTSPNANSIVISKGNGFSETIKIGNSYSARDIMQQALEFGYVDLVTPAPSIADAFKDAPSAPSKVEDFSKSAIAESEKISNSALAEAEEFLKGLFTEPATTTAKATTSKVEDSSYLGAFDIYCAMSNDQALATFMMQSTGNNNLNNLSAYLESLKLKSITELKKVFNYNG